MSSRTLVLVAALLLVGGLAFLTLYVLIKDGPTVLTLTSLLVLALLGFGVFGALSSGSPADRRRRRR